MDIRLISQGVSYIYEVHRHGIETDFMAKQREVFESMRPFAVTDIARMRAILEAFSRLDDIRWNQPTHQDHINFCSDDLTPDEQLLTHWLCYITDRRMPYQKIWDIGGFVISHMVRSYSRENHVRVRQILNGHIRTDEGKMALECPLGTPNNCLERYGINGNSVRFASRYMPEDILLIYRTLKILDIISNRSFAGYLATSIADGFNHSEAIRRIARALEELTYVASGALSETEFDDRMDRMSRELNDFRLEVRDGEELFGRKRLWCSLRDYLKSPELNPHFVAALRGAGFENADQWDRNSPQLKDALDTLELPGDVWNNSEYFRKGLFSPYLANERKSWGMPKTVRNIYDQISATGRISFYPEQLDVTFDFVPRMCEENMCRGCMFGAGIERLCHQQRGLWCSVVLAACGYMHECAPDNCEFRNNQVRGFCRNYR